MTLKETNKATNWGDVRKAILSNYPDQENLIQGYGAVYKKLQPKTLPKSGMELFCELSEPILKKEIISHCLWDMTFHGFSEAGLKKTGKKLEKQVKDMESKGNILAKITTKNDKCKVLKYYR